MNWRQQNSRQQNEERNIYFMTYPIKITVVALIAISTASFTASNASAQPDPSQMPPAQVEVTTATERQMAPEMNVSGTVISLNDSRIATEVEGTLDWIAHVGTRVQKGDTLARINDRVLEITLRRASARLARLKADLTYRNADVERFEELAESNNASQARLQEVIARREMLRQDILEADAVFERARGDLERAQIRAPFSGHIAERLANGGEYLSVGSEVIRLVDTENIEITMAAPIAIMPFLNIGDMVAAKSGDSIRQLPIRTIVPVGDRISRMVEVRLTLEPNSWVIGAPAKVTLPKGKSVRTVAVPRDAIILKGGRAYLYHIDKNNVAQRVSTNIKTVVGLWVSTGDHIKAGDKVVVRGGERLTPGQKVVIKEEE